MAESSTKTSWRIVAGVAGLLLLLWLQLALSVRLESQSWDEGDHIFAGYESWKHGDFGLNPEHPPLVKLLATLPLLGMDLNEPQVKDRYFKEEAFLDGRDFVFGNDAGTILFRARMAASILTICLALLVFFATREMFGIGAAFVALSLLVFDPTLVAHGAYVTTDSGLTLFMFGTIYAFYRYVKAPSISRLIVCGVVAGLALATKHTGILIFPMLAVLALCELIRARIDARRSDTARESDRIGPSIWKAAVRHVSALAVVTLISLAILWAFYGFRYQARPQGRALNPTFEAYVHGLKPLESRALSLAANWRLIPEAYLYGLADVRLTADEYTSYVFGKVYAHGVWFFFPVNIAIKSSLTFLALFLIAVFAIATRRFPFGREILFLTIPPAIHLVVAMSSNMNIGVRHILPVYIFLWVLIGGAIWKLVAGNGKLIAVLVVLVLFQAVSTTRAFPAYVTYANELWGGPSKTYLYLTDSNADWAQQLKSTKLYVDQHGIKNCWFAYFAQTVVEPTSYGIPCKPLPVISSIWLNEPTPVPPAIDGPVFISAGTFSSFELGPGPLNPYLQFKSLKPTALIENSVLVFDGHFEVPLASALGHVQRAQALLGSSQPDQALSEAQAAVALAPNAIQSLTTLGDVLHSMNRKDEALNAYERALTAARTIEPEFQVRSIRGIEKSIAEIRGEK